MQELDLRCAETRTPSVWRLLPRPVRPQAFPVQNPWLSAGLSITAAFAAGPQPCD